MSSTPHTPTEVQDPLPVMSQRFCATDSDITIQSGDGVLFLLHHANLKITLGSWTRKFATTDNEVIQLPETSAVLDLLFQFCYPERQPDVENLEFDILAKLAEAVEKYKVFSAIDVCKIAMRDRLPLNAFDILIYGATHAHPDVYQKAAPVVVLLKPMSEILPRLPSNLLMPWALYHEKWLHVTRDAVSYYHENWAKDHPLKTKGHSSGIYCSCRRFFDVNIVDALLRRLGVGLESYANIATLFESPCGHPHCKHPRGLYSLWRIYVEEKIANIPPLNGPSLPLTDSATQSSSAWTLTTCWNEASKQAVSARFSAPDSDVTFLASDGVRFHIHKINLTVSAGGFAPPEFETCGEIVHLSETTLTLELLFQFCYPGRHPDTEVLEFSEFAILAEAAEKYQVYSAMNICKIGMKKLLPNHASDILAYAARHDYPDIIDVAAPIVVCEECLSETLPKLPPHFVIRWVEYFETVRPPPPPPSNSRDASKFGERNA